MTKTFSSSSIWAFLRVLAPLPVFLLGGCASINHSQDPLGLGQIESSGKKRTQSKFTRFCQSCPLLAK